MEARSQADLVIGSVGRDKAKIEIANENLFSLVSLLAYNCVLAQPKVNKHDLGLLVEIEFNAVLENLHLKRSGDWDNRLFKYLPDKKWPPYFLESIQKKRESKPNRAFLSKFAKSKSKSVKETDPSVVQKH